MNQIMKFSFLFMLSAILVTGCKKDDGSDPNYFQVDDEPYSLSKGTLYYYGASTNGHELSICLLNKEVTVDQDGNWGGNDGIAIYFEVISSSSGAVNSGFYSFPASGEPVFSITDAAYCLNYDEGSMNYWFDLDMCSVIVSQTSGGYVIDFNAVDDLGNAIEGHFSGNLSYFDYSAAP